MRKDENVMTDDAIDLDVEDAEIGFDVRPERPPRGPGRESKFEATFLKLAEDDARATVKVDGRDTVVGATARYPRSGKPEVGGGSVSDLRSKWGKHSRWHEDHGYYFDVILADRVPQTTTGGNRSYKGVLYIRKIYETVDGLPTPKAT